VLSDSTRRTIRTVFQTAVTLAAGLPVILAASGIPENTAAVTWTLAVAGGFTRVMALDVVDALLPSWMRKNSTTSQGGGVE
jgi:hypothetical protein